MHVSLITFTGADDTILPEKIVDFSEQFSDNNVIIEWGVLLSKNNQGSNRYPSKVWIEKLIEISSRLNLSGHIQGQWLRDIFVNGKVSVTPNIWNAFKRIQFNFHSSFLKSEADFASVLKEYQHQYIFQIEDVNNHLYQEAIGKGVDAVPFFDKSAGAGVLPLKWPTPIHPVFNGYAGGLGADNLEEQLFNIAKVATGNIWIDMETKIRERKNGVSVFDLSKCQRVLEIVNNFNKTNATNNHARTT